MRRMMIQKKMKFRCSLEKEQVNRYSNQQEEQNMKITMNTKIKYNLPLNQQMTYHKYNKKTRATN